MISMEQINGEIAVLEEEKPTYIVMQKLANLYTVRSHMIIQNQELSENQMSMDNVENMDYLSKSEFSEALAKAGIHKAFPIIDEMMATVSILNPRLYESMLDKIKAL